MDNSNGSINSPGTPATIKHSPRTARQASDVSQSIVSLSNMSPPTPSNHSRLSHSHGSNSNSNRSSINNGDTTSQDYGHRRGSDDLSDENHPTFRHHRESAHLLDTRHSSYSYSLPRSLDTGHYSDSLDGSPLLYGESFVDHQHLQRQSRDHLLGQLQQHGQGHLERPKKDRGRPSYLARSPSLMGPLPRMMTPSPVPLHARLSKLQKEARRGARVLDMDSNGASHHYDYEDVTDSSYDFSSRRHSVAEEDVCYPLQTTNLDIDYSALEEYIRQEQSKTQKLMTMEQTPPKATRGSQQKAPSQNISSGILSKLKSATLSSSFGSGGLASKGKDASYGSMSKNHPVPERSYSLFGERDKNQIPLDDAYRFTLYSTASVTVHAQTLGEIPPRGQTLSNMLQAGYFWLDVLAPTDEEIRMLSQVFCIHPLTTEDILMEEGREKCEMFLNYYFVCFRTFVLDPNSHNYLQALSVYTLVLPGGIISYHFRPVPHCRNVRKRIRHLKERMEVTPDWINYAIIDDIVDTFAPLIRQVEAEVDMIDELVLILKESEQTDMLRRIGNCRKRVMSLLRLLTGKADVIKGLIKRYEGKMGPKGMGEIGLFMGDIQDHIITMLQNLSHYEKILSRSHSNYLAQINIEMTSASNETNDVLTKLTVLGSIVLPMNLVTGLWGMNVPVPGQESEDLAWFFWIVTAIFMATSLFLLLARKIKLL
ncbi:CorA metal ion transporter [Podila minutissima]|uniref:CorA metal ion transporter n=1 Tax=Podila minutissima TaxID=64525 RepID=A0A9P5VJ10_9FUNG|nr:CorA metal ion transporter [Podila minutissima]